VLQGVYRVVWRVGLANDYQLKEPIIFTTKVLPLGVRTAQNPKLFDMIRDDEADFDTDIVDEAVATVAPTLGYAATYDFQRLLTVAIRPQCSRFEWALGPKSGAEHQDWNRFRNELKEKLKDTIAGLAPAPLQADLRMRLFAQMKDLEQQIINQPAVPPNPFQPQGQGQLQPPPAAQAAANQLQILRGLLDPRARMCLSRELPPLEKLHADLW